MSVPVKGRADFLQEGDWNAICAVCGRKGKASEMYKIPVGLPGAGSWSHSYHEAYKRRQPQDLVRGVPDKMAAPWVQMGGGIGEDAAGAVFQMPTLELNDEDDVTAITGSSGVPTITVTGTGGATLVVTVGSGVGISRLVVEVDPADPDAYVASAIVINNSGTINAIVNEDDVDLTVNSWGISGRWTLAFTVQPTDALIDTEISPAVVVTLVSYGSGDTLTDFTGDVTLALGTNPGGAILSGTLTVAAVLGVATFSGLKLDQSGEGYTLVASTLTAPATADVTSASFDVLEEQEFSVEVVNMIGLDYGMAVAGIVNGAVGSIDPAAFEGMTIRMLFVRTNTNVVTLNLLGVVAQDFFVSLRHDSTTLETADATFTNPSGLYSQWQWSSAWWGVTTSTETVYFII